MNWAQNGLMAKSVKPLAHQRAQLSNLWCYLWTLLPKLGDVISLAGEYQLNRPIIKGVSYDRAKAFEDD